MALAKMPGLVTAWRAHHSGAPEVRTSDEKAKDGALDVLDTLIAAERLELRFDEGAQGITALRFKGDWVLEQVFQGRLVVVQADRGLYVTKIQQALADTSYLAANKVTGTFNAGTGAAVRLFQHDCALPESGAVDRDTMTNLVDAFKNHGVERTLAQTPSTGKKGATGEFKWGSAPAALSAGTRALGAEDQKAALEAVKTSQAAGPSGTLPTFVSDLPAGRYEARLKALVLRLVDDQYERLAKGKAGKRGATDLLDWAQIETVATRSKQATDAIFGKFAVGPPLKEGAGIHDAWDTKVKVLRDVDQQDAAANWRVEKLLTGGAAVRALDQEHGAIQGRGPEKAIVQRVTADVVAAKRDELLEIHKAWPAFASGGEVNIQRFKQDTDVKNRDEMWHLFQTVVHEYLHTLEHSRYKAYQRKLGQQEGSFTLREGVVEYFTHTALDSVTYDDDLRALVEGEFHDEAIQHPIPAYRGYSERANAEKLAGVVGARNVMAAFFLGDVDKIGGKA